MEKKSSGSIVKLLTLGYFGKRGGSHFWKFLFFIFLYDLEFREC